MTKLDKVMAMKCFGELMRIIELDPDPEAQVKLTIDKWSIKV